MASHPQRFREPRPMPAPPAEGSFQIKAILVGWGADIVASLAASLVVGVAAVMLYGSAISQMSEEDLVHRLKKSTPIQALSVVLGLGATVVGGAVAAGMAGEAELKNAGAVGVLSLATAFFMGLSDLAGWAAAATVVLTIPAAVAGGWWQLQRSS